MSALTCKFLVEIRIARQRAFGPAALRTAPDIPVSSEV